MKLLSCLTVALVIEQIQTVLLETIYLPVFILIYQPDMAASGNLEISLIRIAGGGKYQLDKFRTHTAILADFKYVGTDYFKEFGQ